MKNHIRIDKNDLNSGMILNLEKVIAVYPDFENDQYVLTFHFENTQHILWRFETEEQRDGAFEMLSILLQQKK